MVRFFNESTRGNNAQIGTLNQTIVNTSANVPITNYDIGYLSTLGESTSAVYAAPDEEALCYPNNGSKALILKYGERSPFGVAWFNIKVLNGNCQGVIGWVTNSEFHSNT